MTLALRPSVPLPRWAIVGPKRLAHIARVERLLVEWAEAMGTDPAERERWRQAALLHDALRDAPADELARYDPEGRWPRGVRHGPAAAARAATDGERDQGVLDAVCYHSVGYAGWERVGRMLYLADFLEPGREWERRRRAALAAQVPAEPEEVLREVAALRLARQVAGHRPIARETLGFWNALVGHAVP